VGLFYAVSGADHELKEVRADEPKSSEKTILLTSDRPHTRFTATPKVGGVPLLNFEPLHRRKVVINTWEKGERLAKLVANRRTLLLLDGFEPLQNPPGPQEGRLREASLQALLRELRCIQ
jgi:hypothetical protein